jgi:hypothetical protein
MPSHDPQTERFENLASSMEAIYLILDSRHPKYWTEDEAAALDGLRLRARQLFDITTDILEEREH